MENLSLDFFILKKQNMQIYSHKISKGNQITNRSAEMKNLSRNLSSEMFSNYLYFQEEFHKIPVHVFGEIKF